MPTVPKDNFPVHDDRGYEWDADAALTRGRKWASSDGSGNKDAIDWQKYRKLFATYDDGASDFGGFHYPHHDIFDGSPRAVWRGVVAAAQRAQQANDAEARAHLATEYEKWNLNPPWERGVDAGSMHIRDCQEKAASLALRSPEDVSARIFRNAPISVEEVDRAGDIVAVDGGDLSSYLRIPSPPVLVNHGLSFNGLPVARTLRLRRAKTNGKLVIASDFQFRKSDVRFPWVDELHDLWLEGYMSASIGFLPTQAIPIDKNGNELEDGRMWPDGFLFKKWELVEWSLVAVPANRSAIQGASYSPEVKSLFENAPNCERPSVSDVAPESFEPSQELLGIHGVAHLVKNTAVGICPRCQKAAVYYRPLRIFMRHTGLDDEPCDPGIVQSNGLTLADFISRIRHGIDVDVPDVRELYIENGSIILEPERAMREANARIMQVKTRAPELLKSAAEAEAADIKPAPVADKAESPADEPQEFDGETETALAAALTQLSETLDALKAQLNAAKEVDGNG